MSVRTAADVRLEVAQARGTDPEILKVELIRARRRLKEARLEVSLAAFAFSRLVDRAAAATSETFVLESLQMTEKDLIALTRAPSPLLMDLAG